MPINPQSPEPSVVESLVADVQRIARDPTIRVIVLILIGFAMGRA